MFGIEDRDRAQAPAAQFDAPRLLREGEELPELRALVEDDSLS